METTLNDTPKMTVIVPGIHSAIAAIMGEVGGIGKTRANTQQNYKFRGIADVTLACQPLMAKHGVHVVPYRVTADALYERQTKSGGFNAHVRQRVEFRFYHADGSFVSCETTGEAMDTGDKASNKAMAAALKYALTVTFCIPEQDPEVDTETHSPEVKAGPGVRDGGAPVNAAEPPIADKAREIFNMPTNDDQACVERIKVIVGQLGKDMAKPHLTNLIKSKWKYNTAGLVSALKPDDMRDLEAELAARLTAKNDGAKE